MNMAIAMSDSFVSYNGPIQAVSRILAWLFACAWDMILLVINYCPSLYILNEVFSAIMNHDILCANILDKTSICKSWKD